MESLGSTPLASFVPLKIPALDFLGRLYHSKFCSFTSLKFVESPFKFGGFRIWAQRCAMFCKVQPPKLYAVTSAKKDECGSTFQVQSKV